MIDIFQVVRDNDLNKLKENLKYIQINATDEDSNSLLHLAVISNSLEIARFLILNNININLKNKLGQTALHLSVIYNRLAIFKTIIKSGADINICDLLNETPLILSLKLNRVKMTDILISLNANINVYNNKGENTLFFSLYSNRLDLFKDILSKDETLLYSKDKDLNSILHVAVRLGHIKIVKYILNLGFLPNELNSSLETPLFFAARNSDLDIARLLLENGALVEYKNKFYESIFDLGNTRFNSFVTSKTMSSKYIDFKEKYPLSFAVILNDKELFYRYLNTFEINKKDDSNKDALYYARIYNRLEFIKEIENKL